MVINKEGCGGGGGATSTESNQIEVRLFGIRVM